ncbi:hypothetical protein YB2330_001212 [Saitoella coloradoensis]
MSYPPPQAGYTWNGPPSPSEYSHALYNSLQVQYQQHITDASIAALPQSAMMMPPQHISHLNPSIAGVIESKTRRKTTEAQVRILEKAFAENPKPNVAVRNVLAERLLMTSRNIQIWFQNRRAKARAQKREDELRAIQVLEDASNESSKEKKRRTSRSSSMSTTSSEATDLQPDIDATPRKPESAKSMAPVTPSTSMLQQDSKSNYSSPSEASYASLARSLAVAAAAAAAASHGHNASVPPQAFAPPPAFATPTYSAPSPAPMMQAPPPYFPPAAMMYRQTSQFSDYSSACPTPCGDDPFEFDRSAVQTPFVRTPGTQTPDTRLAPEQFPDFAAAIEANALRREIGKAQPLLLVRPHVDRMNSCPADFVQAFDNVGIRSTPALEFNESPFFESAPQQEPAAIQTPIQGHQRTMSLKRRRPNLSPLAVPLQRSKSSMGECFTTRAKAVPVYQVAASPFEFDRQLDDGETSPITPLRRSMSSATILTRSTSKKQTQRKPSVESVILPSPLGQPPTVVDDATDEEDIDGSGSEDDGRLVMKSYPTPLAKMQAAKQSIAPPTPVSPFDVHNPISMGALAAADPNATPRPVCRLDTRGNAATIKIQPSACSMLNYSPPPTPIWAASASQNITATLPAKEDDVFGITIPKLSTINEHGHGHMVSMESWNNTAMDSVPVDDLFGLPHGGDLHNQEEQFKVTMTPQMAHDGLWSSDTLGEIGSPIF